jgi:AmiR/NasT family two-component response regulator
MADASDRERERIERLEAAALLKDERIAELVREVDGLNKAMENRAPIEQAKGVIMSALRCSPEAAFAVLVALSSSENRKLRDIAKDLSSDQDLTGRDEARDPEEAAAGSDDG